MDIVIVGAGICGLSLALNLHERGRKCRVYERAPELTELGVGITLLPHATREFAALGVADQLLAAKHTSAIRSSFSRKAKTPHPTGALA